MKKIALLYSFPINKTQLLLSSIFVLLITSFSFLTFYNDFSETPFYVLKYEYLTKDVHIILGAVAVLTAFISCCFVFAPFPKIYFDKFDGLKRSIFYFISNILLLYVTFVILSNVYINDAYMAP